MKRLEPKVYKTDPNFTLILRILKATLKAPGKPRNNIAQVGYKW